MKHFNKKFLLVTIFLCIFMFSGCGTNNGKDDYNTNGNSESGTSKDTGSTTDKKPVDQQDNSSSAPSSIKPVANKKLMIYTINEEEIEPATAMIPEEEKITPRLIVNTVVEALEDQSISVGIEDVTSKGNTVIVSFYHDKAPLANVGSKYEKAILNAIAQSLIDNLKECHKVIYRVEGKAYISSHLKYGINDAYIEEK